jgi:hypothetical protein
MKKHITQIASVIGAAVVIGVIAVYKDTFRSWFTQKPQKKDTK